MTQKGTEFELLVKAIYEEILAYDGYDTIRVEHDMKVLGKSGQLHQIDVYWEFNMAGVTHRVAVECKEYKNTVSVGKVRDFYGALEDIGNIYGIFVTTKGYQSGAITYGKHKDISLKVVQTPTEKDIEKHQGIKTININMNFVNIGNVSITPIFDVDWVISNTSIKEGDQLSFNELNSEVKIIDSNSKMLGTILDFENKLPRERHSKKGLKHKYEFKEGFLHVPSSKYPPLKIISLNFEYDTYTLSTTSKINFKIMAQAVLKDIITGESHLFKKKVEKL